MPDFRRDHYVFQRQERPESKLLPFEPLDNPMWKDVAAGLLIIFFIALLAVLT